MTYRVWCRDEFEDADEDERADRAWKVPPRRGILYPENSAPCDDPQDAARQFADHCNARRDSWEWSWPQEFVVHDGASYFLIEVEREMVAEFLAGKPVPFSLIEPEPDPDAASADPAEQSA